MPLIVIVGLPCSGKTTVSEAIREYLVANGQEVELVNDESLGINKQEAYASMNPSFFRLY